MEIWWRSRQWVYARPPIAGVVALMLLAFVGFGGWSSARWVSGDEAAQKTSVVLQRLTVARTVPVKEIAGRVAKRSGLPTQVAGTPALARTVVVTERVTRAVPMVRTRTATAVRTITNVRSHTVTQTSIRTVTVPPGHATPKGRDTQTVTVTRTVTVATITVTRGH